MHSSLRVSPRNFLAGLNPDHFEVLRALMTERRLAAGEVLVEPGDRGTAAYVIDEGELEIFSRLPGGGESVLATASSGELLGELALLTDTPRTAGLRARSDARLLAIDRRDFQGMLSWYHPASLGVLRRLVLLECHRVWQITGAVAAMGGQAFPGHPTASADALAASDLAPIPLLLRLPELADFTPEDLEGLLRLGRARLCRAPAGAVVAAAGQPGHGAWLVVRGALEILVGDASAGRRVGVHGPGVIEGVLALLLGRPQPMTLRVREDALLLELPGEALQALLDEGDRVSFKLLSTLARGVASHVALLNRQLSRLQRTTRPRQAPPHPSRARVLVVDDSPMNRGLLAMHLDEMGHDSVAAKDGQEALERLTTGAFDAVLLDLQMPVVDGFGVLAAMEADPRLRGIPVIVITAVDSLESAIRCLRAGAMDYLPRSFDPAVLRARLHGCLERDQLQA